MVHYYISLRKISAGTFTNEIDIGTLRYLKVPEDRPPQPGDAISRTQWVSEIIASYPTKLQKGKQVPTGDLAFFVHGFNNTLSNVYDRQILLQQGLNQDGFYCPVISFDWPSDASTVGYLDDLDHAKKTAFLLVNAAILLFVRSLQANCDIRAHVIGHSMGAFLIREAFDHADDNAVAAATTWTAGQVVLLAGDASAAKFAQTNTETESLYRHSNRLTNYWSGYDVALQVSNIKRLGIAPRVGRVGLPEDAPSKAVNVDCSKHYASQYHGDVSNPVLTHSWYFNDASFMRDLRLTLQGSIDRFKLPTRRNEEDGTQELL